jgi:uncharacterized membrane protein
MKRYLILLIMALSALMTVPTSAQEETVVHAVMFWMEGCGHCTWVKSEVLPPLAEQYGDQWRLELIELRSAEDFDRLYNLGAAIGVPRENIGVPFLLIGDSVLIGSGQIPTELPGLIEKNLAAGGTGWPTAAGLEWFLPQVKVEADTRTTPENALPAEFASNTPTNDGFLLATLILIGMVLALGYTAVTIWRARHGAPVSEPPAWTQIALPLLAVTGLIVAGYLAYVETQAVTAVCGPVGDCNAVQTSEFAYLFGIPIGVLGVVGYMAILVVWAWGRWRANETAMLVILGMSGLGVLFSIYLTYLEPFVLGAVCAWCLTSAVVMALLLMVSVKTALPQLARMRDGY